jgi:hypothetical protein
LLILFPSFGIEATVAEVVLVESDVVAFFDLFADDRWLLEDFDVVEYNFD